jgi:hypothetical protein
VDEGQVPAGGSREVQHETRINRYKICHGIEILVVGMIKILASTRSLLNRVEQIRSSRLG